MPGVELIEVELIGVDGRANAENRDAEGPAGLDEGHEVDDDQGHFVAGGMQSADVVDLEVHHVDRRVRSSPEDEVTGGDGVARQPLSRETVGTPVPSAHHHDLVRCGQQLDDPEDTDDGRVVATGHGVGLPVGVGSRLRLDEMAAVAGIAEPRVQIGADHRAGLGRRWQAQARSCPAGRVGVGPSPGRPGALPSEQRGLTERIPSPPNRHDPQGPRGRRQAVGVGGVDRVDDFRLDRRHQAVKVVRERVTRGADRLKGHPQPAESALEDIPPAWNGPSGSPFA